MSIAINNNSDKTLLSATIKTTATSRIEASGGGTFNYGAPGSGAQGSELDCQLEINGAAMGNPTQAAFSGNVSYREPGSAGGAAVKPAGTYVITLRCHATQLAGTASLTFLRGDLNVVAAAP